MNFTRHIVGAIVALAFTAAFDAPALAKDRRIREDMKWKDVPAAVQATIEQHAAGGKIIEVTRESRRGETNYSAEVLTADAKMKEIEVQPSGKLIAVTIEEEADASAARSRDLREKS